MLLCEMMDVHLTYGDNHFMMYVSQIIMFYMLNVYSAVFQLYLTKSEGKNSLYNLYFLSQWRRNRFLTNFCSKFVVLLPQVNFFSKFISLFVEV